MKEKKDWSRGFNGIGVKLEPQVVRVANDFVLDVYLQSDPKNCMRLADHICRAYRKTFGEELKITRRSLAIEIYGHYRMQKMAEKVESAAGRNSLTGWLIAHTTVIDCGSAEKDGNRFVWDAMSRLSDAERRTGLIRLRGRS